MAIRLFRIVVLILAVLLLGSCNVLQFIFGSVFPATLALVKAQTDLSKLIPANNNGSTYLRLAEVGGHSYVIITGSPSPSKYFAYFYDSDLNLTKSLTGASAPLGTGVMVDASSLIAVGNKLFNTADLSLATAIPATVYAQGNSGTDGFVYSGSNYIGIIISSPPATNTLTYSFLAGDWSSGSQTTKTLSANTFGLQLNAVFDDGAGNVIMVISQGSSGGNNNDTVNAHFVTVPKSAFTGTFPTNPYDSAPQRDNLVSESFGFANGSIFAYDSKASSLVRINPADASTQNSLPLGSNNKGQVKYAYSLSGGTFYTFDTDARILTKYVAWW